jgi:tRNA pseudouridine38-40 synthase
VNSYRIDLKYVGSDFHGWQSQPSGRGVQDHLEKALKTMLRHDVRVTAASRTDTGVHAEHQVVTFKSPLEWQEKKWLKSLHGLLPDSIGITSIKPVAADFHPIYSGKAKAYRYRLWFGADRNPLIAPFCWQLYAECDVQKLAAEAQAVVGTHDFSAFCAADSSAKTKVRRILEVDVRQQGSLVDVWFMGEGFLKQMIRIIVGTLVEVGMGKVPPGQIARAIASGNRDDAGKTAYAQGLTLVEIFYDEVPRLADLQARIAGQYSLKIR